MEVQIPKEKWTGKIKEFTFGATSGEGGTRSNKIALGGASTLPYLYFEGDQPHKTVIVMEVRDVVRDDYAAIAKEAFEGVIDSPTQWAKACVEQHGADAICLKLEGTNPEEENKSADEASDLVKEVLVH